MVVRCSRCMGFKRSTKSTCKKCMRRRGQRGHSFGKFFKKATGLVKKVVKPVIGYRPRMSREWRDRGLFESTEQRLCDQA